MMAISTRDRLTRNEKPAFEGDDAVHAVGERRVMGGYQRGKPGPADEAGRGALVSATIKEFGTDPDMRSALIHAINSMRLKDLPERKDKQGTIVFEKGRGDMNSLVREIPTLINVIHAQVEAERKTEENTRPTDYSGFDDYQTNLAALRRLNGMVKRYLDIDVTIDKADIRQLSESVKALR